MNNNESASESKLTQKRLKELLHYDSETGVFTRKVDRGPQKKGDSPGCVNKGYLRIYMDGRTYYAHRLAWLYFYGELPKELDHINHDSLCNRIENLRCVSREENAKNRTLSKNNKSGISGVRWYRFTKTWVAQLGVNGTHIHLGYFKNKEDAIMARKEAERKHGFHANHGNKKA